MINVFWIKIMLAILIGQFMGSVVVWSAHGGMPPFAFWLSLIGWQAALYIIGFRMGRKGNQAQDSA